MLSLLLGVQNLQGLFSEYNAVKIMYVCYAYIPVARSPGDWIFTVAPNICRLSASYLLLVPFLAPRISKWLPGCWESCGPLHHDPSGCLHRLQLYTLSHPRILVFSNTAVTSYPATGVSYSRKFSYVLCFGTGPYALSQFMKTYVEKCPLISGTVWP
jgi:hypothetical protein